MNNLKVVEVDKKSIIAYEHVKPIFMYKVFDVDTGKRLYTFEFKEEKSTEEILKHYKMILMNDILSF